MQKSRQYSSPPQVLQQKKGANEHFCATDALAAADDSKGTQKPAGNGLSPHASARRSPQPSARSKPRVNGYNTFTTDTNSAYSISAKGSSLLELPVMLAISWFVCAKVIARYQLLPRISPRLTMGVAAFSLLMLAELFLSPTLFDLNYSISLNSATTTSYRTGYHQVQLNLAYVF